MIFLFPFFANFLTAAFALKGNNLFFFIITLKTFLLIVKCKWVQVVHSIWFIFICFKFLSLDVKQSNYIAWQRGTSRYLSEASSLPPRDPNAKGLDTLGECLRTEPSFGSNSKIWCDSWGEVAL